MSETLARVMPYAVDLGKTIKKTYLDTLFATDDSEAHRFDIILYRDNAKLTIPSSATVSAYFIRYGDDVTIPFNGSADGNVVSVTLKKSCYNKAGQFALIIKVATGSETSTVFYGEGAIFTSSTDSILDDEHIIPSISELLAQIDAMEAATASANTAIGNANTATDNANEAARKANTAANTANTAAENANESAGNADTARDAANAAAGKIDSMTVVATTLETGSPATATLETVDGHYQLNLGLPKGATGNTGATPNISVQVETGAAGSEATVSVSGTAEEPLITLTIPRGDPGRDGSGAGTVTAVKVAGETHAPDDTGVVDLGQITGGADLSDAAPAALGTAAAGASGLAARADHVHPMPTAAQVGAATAESVSQLKNDKLDKTETAADSSKLCGKEASEYALKDDISASGAGAHNSIYRGKSLGSAVTADQYAAIQAGTFEDMYIGDYWTVGGVAYRIAAFDYYLRAGDTDMTTHHVTLVPDAPVYSHVMNDSNVTTDGYVGSKMYITGLADAKTTINNAFGSAHILSHRQYLCNAVRNGKPSGGSWYDSTVELMTEQNVCGGKLLGAGNDGSTVPNLYTVDKSQYPLFTFRPDLISKHASFWLRDVSSTVCFTIVYTDGRVIDENASKSYGVRPAFSIIG